MLSKRIIPCLDYDLGVPEGRVVKGVEFKEFKPAGSPSELAEKYYQRSVDEIVFLDITASKDQEGDNDKCSRKNVRKCFRLSHGGRRMRTSQGHRRSAQKNSS